MTASEGFPSPAGVFFISSKVKYLGDVMYFDTFPSPVGVFFISSLYEEWRKENSL